MPTHDLARVLREYTLEPLRQELRAAFARVLLIEDTAAIEELRGTGVSFDAAWVQLESPGALELERLAGGVVRVLRPGARLVCVVPGAWPLARLLARGLRARGEAPGVLREQIEGRKTSRPAFSAWRRAFEPEISWRRSRALGVLVPPAASWPRLHPLTLGLLATAEDVMGSWPLVRRLGDWTVHEGVRR